MRWKPQAVPWKIAMKVKMSRATATWAELKNTSRGAVSCASFAILKIFSSLYRYPTHQRLADVADNYLSM